VTGWCGFVGFNHFFRDGPDDIHADLCR
jgi:hypothetical protein